ncbi:MAG: hypothetical protein J1G30_04895 [Spirochaetales bacterium]|nr:hypothetical protein [Spirochaetales bacterium]
MKIVQIDKLVLIDNHIYYIKKYLGSVVFLNEKSRIIRADVVFTLEIGALGDPNVSIDKIDLGDNLITDSVKNEIKNKILVMEQQGELPGVIPESL